MKKIVISLVLVLLAALSVSCSKAADTGWKEFSNKDFSFKYPSGWTAATEGDTLDNFKAKGVVAVNNFGEKDFWVKPIVRSELIHAGGGLMAKKLPKNGVYMFVMEIANADGKDSSISDLNAPTKPHGTPKDFNTFASRVLGSLDKLPKEAQEKVMQKWDVQRDWLHYRVEIKNHGKNYDAHIYVLGDSLKKDVKTVEETIKSFKLVNPSPKNK